MAISSEDVAFLREALELARLGSMTTAPNPAVGCLLVRQGHVIGRGFHRQAGAPHAEVNAIADYSLQGTPLAGVQTLNDVCVYVTLEPCSHTGRTPPCANALIQSGVSRVVVGMLDPNPQVAGRGIERLVAAGILVEVLELQLQQSSLDRVPGCATGDGPWQLYQDILALNEGYIHRHRSGTPLVRLKLAASLDGRTAMANGESRWITGPEARADVHYLRAHSGAIITGIETVLTDDAALTVRPQAHGFDYPEDCDPFPFAEGVRQPLRVVLDSRFRLPLSHRLCQQPGQTLIVGVQQPATHEYPVMPLEEISSAVLGKHQVLGAWVSPESGHQQRVPLAPVLALLARLEVSNVLVEAGPTLAGAFVAADCVDELWLYQAPKLLGDGARPLVRLDCQHLSEASQWLPESVKRVGQDYRMIFRKP